MKKASFSESYWTVKVLKQELSTLNTDSNAAEDLRQAIARIEAEWAERNDTLLAALSDYFGLDEEDNNLMHAMGKVTFAFTMYGRDDDTAEFERISGGMVSEEEKRLLADGLNLIGANQTKYCESTSILRAGLETSLDLLGNGSNEE